MRKLFYWFFVICLVAGPVTAHAWFMLLAGGGVRTGVADVPNVLMHSDFEDATDRAQWDYGVNYDAAYASAGLDMGGDFALMIDNSGYLIEQSFTSQSDQAWIVARYRQNYDYASDETLVRFKDSPASNKCYIIRESDGDIKVSDGTLTSTAISAGLLPDVTRWLKLTWKPAVSNDGICIGSYWDGAEWQDTSITTSAVSGIWDEILLLGGDGGTGAESYWDDFWLFDADYTGNPNDLEETYLVGNDSLVFYSDFEDSEDRAQWTASGTPDTDHSSSGLSMTGNYVVRIDSGESMNNYNTLSNDYPVAYIISQIRFENTPPSGYTYYLRDLNDTLACRLYTNSTPVFQTRTSSYGTGTTTLAADTTYWVKIEYNANTEECNLDLWDSTNSEWDREVTNATAPNLDNFEDLTIVPTGTSAGDYVYIDELYILTEDWIYDPALLKRLKGCPPGDYEAAWTGDAVRGPTYLCYQDHVAPPTTNTVDSISSDYISYDSHSNYIQWSPTAGTDFVADIPEAGSMFVEFEVAEGSGSDRFLSNLWDSATNQYIAGHIEGADEKYTTRHVGSGGANTINTFPFYFGTSDRRYRCAFSWDVTANDTATECVSSGPITWANAYEDTSANNSSWTNDITWIRIGGNGNFGVQTIATKVYNWYLVEGYKATDPTSTTTSTCMDGTYEFAWDGDHALGTEVACVDDGFNLLSGTNTSMEVGSEYGENGSNGVLLDNEDYNNLYWLQTAGQYMDSSTPQTVWFRMKLPATPLQTYYIFEGYGASANYIGIYTDGATLSYQGVYRGTTNGVDSVYSGDVTADTWVDIAYAWDEPNGDHSFYVSGGVFLEDADELTDPLDSEITKITLGKDSGTGTVDAGIYADKFAIVDGYQALRPWTNNYKEIMYSGFEYAGDRGQWDTVAGTPTFNHSSSGLSMTDSYVVRLSGESAIIEAAGFAPYVSDTVSVVFQARYEDGLEGNKWQVGFDDNADATLCDLVFKTDGSIYSYVNSDSSYISSAHSADSTAWYKIYYTKGTGSNAVCGVGHWNGSSWDTAERTDGDETTNVDTVQFRNMQDGGAAEYWYYDDIHILEYDYTGDPTDLEQ